MSSPASHLSWFQNDPAYAGVDKSFAAIGSHGVHLTRTRQPSGIYRRPAAHEITLQMPLTPGARAVLDHGQVFEVRNKAFDLIIGPPDTDLIYDVPCELDFIVATMPKAFFAGNRIGNSGSVDFGQLYTELFTDDLVATILKRLWSLASDAVPVSSIFADSALLTLTHALLARAGGTPDGSEARSRKVRGGLAGWQLKRVREAMDARLDQDVGLASLADIAGLSATHFSRAFKQSTGVSPFTWLRERRVERAKELLADIRLPLVEVALAIGFSAQPEFTTAFKRATGVTPGAWRRERLS